MPNPLSLFGKDLLYSFGLCPELFQMFLNLSNDFFPAGKVPQLITGASMVLSIGITAAIGCINYTHSRNHQYDTSCFIISR
jgi:hypothetical protein